MESRRYQKLYFQWLIFALVVQVMKSSHELFLSKSFPKQISARLELIEKIEMEKLFSGLGT